MRVLDIVYPALGLGVPETRWVLVMMMDGGGGFLLGIPCIAFDCVRSASVTVRRFGRCQCQFPLLAWPAPSLGRGVNRYQLEGWMITWYSGTFG